MNLAEIDENVFFRVAQLQSNTVRERESELEIMENLESDVRFECDNNISAMHVNRVITNNSKYTMFHYPGYNLLQLYRNTF